MFSAVAGLAACAPVELGSCDTVAATQLAYDLTGLPMYEGQALLAISCSDGACHGTTIRGDDRRGAPVGLDYDVQLTTGGNERLLATTGNVRRDATDIFEELDCESMPPSGRSLMQARENAEQWVRADGAPLPPIDSSAARAIVQNWLACDAPIVERTEERPVGEVPVGDIIALP